MHHFSVVFASILFALIGLGWSASSSATDLTPLVPADAVVVLSWHGMRADDPAYAESWLKAMLDDTDMGGRIRRSYTAAYEEYARKSEDAQLGLDLWKEIYPLVWGTPWVFYFEGVTTYEPVDATPQRKDTPRMGFVVEPGENAAVIRKWLVQLEEALQLAKPDPSIRLLDDGQYLGILIGTSLANDPADAIALSPRFTTAFTNLSVAPRVQLYVDLAALREMVQRVLPETDPWNEGATIFTSLMGLGPAAAALGTDAVDRFAFAGGFNSRDWEQIVFCNAPTPRAGLLALLDQPVLEEADLAAVPRSATWMQVRRFDVAAALDRGLSIVGQINGEGDTVFGEFDQGFAGQFGFDIRRELLPELSDVWTVYADPSFGGMFGSNIALVQTVSNPAKVEEVLLKLTAYINQEMGDDGVMHFVEQSREDMTLHTMLLPFASPTWSVVDGRLILGFSPQTITSARSHGNQPENALIADRQSEFERLIDRMPHAHEATSLTYTDYEKTAASIYSAYTTALGFFAMSQPDAMPFNPAEMIPPLQAITPHLSPGVRLGWVDEMGYHQRSLGPFPGATLLSPDLLLGGGAIPTAGLATAVLMPAIQAARTTTQQVQSMSNLRVLQMGLHSFAADHEGRFPASLGELYPDGYVPNLEVFIAPLDPDQFWIGAPPNDAVVRLVNEKSSYVFVMPATKVHSIVDPPTTITVVEHPRVWLEDGRHYVGYADGHVEARSDPIQTRKQIQAQSGKTIEQFIADAADASLHEVD